MQQIVLPEIAAQVGEITEQEGLRPHTRCKRDNLSVLMFGEAQNQITRHRQLRREPLGTELARIDAVECHELRARWVDWAIDEPLCACAVGFDATRMEEMREQQFAHG